MESRKSHYLRTKLAPYTSPLERDGTIAICANMKLSKIPFLNTLVGFALYSSSILCACEICINEFFNYNVSDMFVCELPNVPDMQKCTSEFITKFQPSQIAVLMTLVGSALSSTSVLCAYEM
mgnify:CR=1 FL=1